jgi:hypothetical protein
VTADRGYDHDITAACCADAASEIARRKTARTAPASATPAGSSSTFAWVHYLRRLLVRYDPRAKIHESFLAIGCCLVCHRRLTKSL